MRRKGDTESDNLEQSMVFVIVGSLVCAKVPDIQTLTEDRCYCGIKRVERK